MGVSHYIRENKRTGGSATQVQQDGCMEMILAGFYTKFIVGCDIFLYAEDISLLYNKMKIQEE